MENKEVVMRIKMLIESKNVSPSGFAKLIGYNQSNLSKVLRGERVVPTNLFNARDFDGKTIIYNRTKTKDRRTDNAEIHVDVQLHIMPLVEKYRGKERVFNFCEQYSSMADFNRAINIGLKQVGKYVVNDMLNHTDPSLKVTELYIKRDFKIINVANMEVLNFVLGQTKGRVRADLQTLQ